MLLNALWLTLRDATSPWQMSESSGLRHPSPRGLHYDEECYLKRWFCKLYNGLLTSDAGVLAILAEYYSSMQPVSRAVARIHSMCRSDSPGTPIRRSNNHEINETCRSSHNFSLQSCCRAHVLGIVVIHI